MKLIQSENRVNFSENVKNTRKVDKIYRRYFQRKILKLVGKISGKKL
jgi:hypothetical protein